MKNQQHGLSIFDKTLFLQRLIFAVSKLSPSNLNDDSAEWNQRKLNEESEKHLDEAIESLLSILVMHGYIPAIKEI